MIRLVKSDCIGLVAYRKPGKVRIAFVNRIGHSSNIKERCL